MIRWLLITSLFLLCGLAQAQSRPADYSAFNTNATTASQIASVIQGTGTDYLWVPPGTYTFTCPLVINRTGSLYVHSLGAFATIFQCSNPTQPLFQLTAAALVNFSGFACWPTASAQTATAAQCLYADNPASTIFEAYDLLILDASVEIDGPGSFWFQADAFSTGGMVASAITVNHAGADILVFGGDMSSGAASLPTFAASDYAFVWQKQGCVRVYGTTTESGLGTADFRFEAACMLRRAHIIANERSEGNNGYLNNKAWLTANGITGTFTSPFTFTGTTTSGSNVITSVSSTAGILVGMAISGLGLSGAYVTNVTSNPNTVTITSAPTFPFSNLTITAKDVLTWTNGATATFEQLVGSTIYFLSLAGTPATASQTITGVSGASATSLSGLLPIRIAQP